MIFDRMRTGQVITAIITVVIATGATMAGIAFAGRGIAEAAQAER